MEKRKNYFSWIIATWFGSGLLTIAPGTWGSLAAFPFAYIISVNSGPYVLIMGTVAGSHDWVKDNLPWIS